jgi:hypothetical protein
MRACVVALLLGAVPVSAAPSAVFERVDPLEVRTGIVRLRIVQAPIVEVPSVPDRPADETGDPATWSATRFVRLFAAEFRLETRRAGAEPVEDDRGTLLIALGASDPDALILEEKLRTHLGSLGPDAFVAPLAGIQEGAAPLDTLAMIAASPSWTCRLLPASPAAGLYSRTMGKESGNRDRVASTSITGFSSGEIPARLCPALVEVAAGTPPEEIRTLPVPRALRETRVEMEAVDRLSEEIRPGEVVLPAKVVWSRRKATGVASGKSTRQAWDGSSFRATQVLGEVEWDATTVPSALPPDLLAGGAYVARWSLRTNERRLGVDPRNETGAGAEITLALVPLVPPPVEGLESSRDDPIPVDLDANALRSEVARRLDGGATLDAATLEKALTEDPAGLEGAAWMLVVCRQDGTASFGLLPTSARSPVTNAPLFCAAVERMLPRAGRPSGS